MNPNSVNKFASAAIGIDRRRSTFNRPSRVLTTFDSGSLIPIYWDEVLPGDNYLTKINGVVRMTTPIRPVMDNCYIDLYAFYVPNRLLWKHWKEFMGENNSTADPWTPTETYQVPQISIPTSRDFNTATNSSKDLLNYLGIPPYQNPAIASDVVKVNALPVRAYCKIWNDFFRDENLQVPINFSIDDNDVSYFYENTGSSWQVGTVTGGNLAPVGKFKDYFTSALPAPQRGDPVPLNIGGLAPVITRSDSAFSSVAYPLQFKTVNNANVLTTSSKYNLIATATSQHDANLNYLSTATTSASSSAGLVPSNLWTDLSQAVGNTVNNLRYSIAVQHFQEQLARSGSRYIELLYSLFGVHSSDSRLQRAEYLGGKRIPITITQVTNQTAGSDNESLGATAAYSLTGFSENLSNHFFEEHGIFMIVGAVRTDQTYCNGISRHWLRKDRFDYYAPPFANLGEMPIKNIEIFNSGRSLINDGVFGYQEAWAEYRYKPNICTGLLNPSAQSDLATWSYTLGLSATPTLNSNFIVQDKRNVGQTLTNQTYPQFVADFYVENKTTRVMPMYSVPGLLKV